MPRALLLAVPAVAGVMLTAAPPARADPPRVNGDVVYERGGDLFAVGTEALVEASKAVRLTRDGRANRDPAWSARASHLAYSSRRGGDSDIWAMDLLSGEDGPERLTDDPAADTSPTWSPKGASIAFTSRRGGTSDVWVMNADGAAPRALASGPAVERQPAWSPDGAWIAFASNRGGSYAIWVIRPDGTGARRLAPVGTYAAEPTWNPQSDRIAVAAGSGPEDTGIVTVDVRTGTDVRSVTPIGSGDRAPAWSPDGLQILYTRNGALRYSDVPGVSPALVALAAKASRVRVGRNADWGPLPMPDTPEPGESVTAIPTGEIEVRVPGSDVLQPLDTAVELPIGTLISTGDDAALDIVAANGDGETTSALLSGQFIYSQTADGESNDVEFREPEKCPASGRATASAWVQDRGYIKVTKPGRWTGRGPHTKGASSHTAWYMKVTCDKEITVVTEGIVDVSDPDRPAPIPVAAGECYVYPSATGRPLPGTCDVTVPEPTR